jgi:hypothetical protein
LGEGGRGDDRAEQGQASENWRHQHHSRRFAGDVAIAVPSALRCFSLILRSR